MVHPYTRRERRVLEYNFAGLVFQQRNITLLDAFFFSFPFRHTTNYRL